MSSLVRRQLQPKKISFPTVSSSRAIVLSFRSGDAQKLQGPCGGRQTNPPRPPHSIQSLLATSDQPDVPFWNSPSSDVPIQDGPMDISSPQHSLRTWAMESTSAVN